MITRDDKEQNNQHDDPLLTAQEAADLLRVSPKTVLRWARGGLLEVVRVTPRTLRFRRGSVEAFVARFSR